VLDELIPSAWHHVEQYANNPIEADHGRLKHRLRPIRGLRTDRTAQVITAGYAFIQNLRRDHYELDIDAPPATRVAGTFAELARTIWPRTTPGFNTSTDPTTQRRRLPVTADVADERPEGSSPSN
jgi:hypothetical protein